MFLKSLQIKGFKSFADPATLSLEPGVTVVVGPNGSGKSNVVDAIGWVLGAQKPSTVRSGKMEDVIFAGTSKRAALGRAEVSLTIDNSAGMLPIEFTEVTITRLLFRSGDSEYAINGVPCRLLDIQDLLSDSGVGKQQHVIISQGNIDAVLNARPEDRRLIIEEAAGVLKFRRRKERAERRLTATEANLTRVQDLLREVRRQLRPLERQADAARRHGALVKELTALRVHLSGRELARLRARLTESSTRQGELRRSDQELRVALAEMDTRIITAESQLGSLGGRDLGDSLVRYEKLSEKARGLTALLAERRRGLERELNVSVDEGVIASLESEQSRLRGEQVQIATDSDALIGSTDELRVAENALAGARVDFETEWGDGVIAPTGEASAVRGELDALRSAIGRTAADEERLQLRQQSLTERIERQRADHHKAVIESKGAETATVETAGDVEQATKRRVAAEAELLEVESLSTAAESEYSGWKARSEALSLALDDARQRAGAEHLAGLNGVLGTLLDLVQVDDGWEGPFEAAAGEALDAVVVRDINVATAALRALESGDHRGAILALEGIAAVTRSVVAGGTPIRDHVRALRTSGSESDPEAIERLLDRLLVGAVVVDADWTGALQVASVNPDAIVISRDGDRFGPSGWRLGSSGTGATGAALEEARSQVELSDEARGGARARMESARATVAQLRQDEQSAIRKRDSLEATRKSSAQAITRLDSEVAETEAELASLVGHISEIAMRREREAVRVGELEAALPELEAAEAELGEKARAIAEARRQLETHSATVASMRTDLEVRTAAIEERRRFVSARLEQIDERLERNIAERDAATARRVELHARAEATDRLHDFVTARVSTIESNLGELREEQRRQSEAARSVAGGLEAMRRERSASEKSLEEIRAQIQKAEIEDAETKLRLETATTTLRSELDTEPDQAISAVCPALPDGVSPAARVRELERELRLMGPINPLALQEFTELQERHTFLEGQLDDIRSTRRELSKVIRAVEEEIVNVFTAAYADVSINFTKLFETLFPGGEGKLKLTDPNNLLETGIEIEARPSGKNVRKLSLLSGGERSLTALAYLFAVFRSRPSPFYVMDEVEAALDDVNLHRFLGLIAEFRQTAQLIIVSHQKRTMEAADVLYGVTMEPGGSSKVVSEKASSVF
ncbi:MAG: chromosome segregation protein SMC [Microthrixaceae bacterium]